MAFFQRVMNYLLNEVLVNGLANSRTFQRFAIRSSKAMEEVAKKGVEHKEALGAAAQEHGPRLGAFWQTFRQEMTKGLKDINMK